MKIKSLIFCTIIFIFCSCSSSFVQVFETSTGNKNIKDESNYVYENDSIKITYNLWEDKGKMRFVVYNKLKKPLYIDWKKSSYISNTIKISYWEDVTTTNSAEARQTIIENKKYNNGFNIRKYYVSNSIGVSSSSSSKPEKITFIPPNSNYFRTQFKLFPTNELNVKDYNIIEISALNNKAKTEKAYQKNLSKNESPLVFRNFITMSYNENFTSEFYVDNEFYVSKVIKLNSNQFEAIKRKENSAFFETNEDGKLIKINPYKSEKSFYIKIK
jgi:hypothetical protein